MRILSHLCALLLLLWTSFSFSVGNGGVIGVPVEPVMQDEGVTASADNSGVGNGGVIGIQNGAVGQGGMVMPATFGIGNGGVVGVPGEPVAQGEMVVPIDNSGISNGSVVGVPNGPIVQGEMVVPVDNSIMEDGSSIAEDRHLSDKKHIHSYVDQLLGTGDVNNVDPEKLSEASVAMQVHNLQKNMEALQFSLSKFEESQKSKKSKANTLYTKIKSAFTEYFNGELPDSEKNTEEAKSSEGAEKLKEQKGASSLGKTHDYAFEQSRSSRVNGRSKHSNYSRGYPTKSYGSVSRIGFPTKYYGATRRTNYPTKSYAKSSFVRSSAFSKKSYGEKNFRPTKVYTVKNFNNQYFKKKGCCGKDG